MPFIGPLTKKATQQKERRHRKAAQRAIERMVLKVSLENTPCTCTGIRGRHGGLVRCMRCDQLNTICWINERNEHKEVVNAATKARDELRALLAPLVELLPAAEPGDDDY